MEYLKRLFDRPSPEHLYHYTNANSFLGIIQKTEMWASHIRFMNDLKEEVYALELLERRLPDLLKTTSLNPNKMIKLIQKYFDEENSKFGIFVLSFSEKSDDLNQWRGYANGTPSYCIKFNSNKIKKNSEVENDVENVKLLIDSSWDLNDHKRKIFLLPCVYDDETQNNLIDEIANTVLQNSYEIDEKLIAKKIARTLIFYSPLIKHRMSEDEKEWRIIIVYEKSFNPNFTREDLQKELNATNNEYERDRLNYEMDCFEDNEYRLKIDKELLGFRMGKSYIIPYYKFMLEKEAFEGFIIGACPDYNSVKESTIYFLSKNGFTYEESKKMVTKTKNPYRNW